MPRMPKGRYRESRGESGRERGERVEIERRASPYLQRFSRSRRGRQ